MKATTSAPDEVKRLFTEYAQLLDIYASDQLAIAYKFGQRGTQEYRAREATAKLYSEIAAEIRSIEFELPT